MVIPVEQRHWRQKELEPKGDCLKCSIASVLELPYRQVPHFVQRHGKRWATHLRPWLHNHGYDFLYYTLHDFKKDADWLPSGYWIATVKRPTGKTHAVVMLGPDLAYDPNPDPEAGGYTFNDCGCLLIFPQNPTYPGAS